MADKKPLIAIVNSSSFGISYPEHLRKLEEFADLIRVDIPNNAPASVFHEKLREADGIIASVTPVGYKQCLRQQRPRSRCGPCLNAERAARFPQPGLIDAL